MVTLQATTRTELSCSLLFDQIMNLYAERPAVISNADHKETQLHITFDDWASTSATRDFLERFGDRYSVIDVEWL